LSSESRSWIAPTGALLGVSCIAAGVALLSGSDAIIKGLRVHLPTMEIICIRSLFGLIPVLVILQAQRAWSSLKTRRPVAQIVRGGLIVVSYALFLEALAVMPLALTVALTFCAPLFVAALSPVILKERVTMTRWIGVGVGFLGVLVIVRPGMEAFRPEALIALGAALAYAASSLLARRLGATDPPAATAFYTGIMFFVGSLPFVLAFPETLVAPNMNQIGLLVVTGLIAGTAHFLIIAAYRHAQAAIVAPFEYTGLIWAAFYGLVFWDEIPDWPTTGGIVLIMAGGLWIIFGERRRRSVPA
jgi:drug/metabolite transporter (DMT)-like permease